MLTQGQSTNFEHAETPPLTIPADVWRDISSEEKAVLQRAQRALDHLVLRETMTVPELREATGFKLDELLTSLRALAGMRLVAFDSDGQDLVANLIAIPDEHVRIVGPDEKARWLFVARPLVPPDVDPKELN